MADNKELFSETIGSFLSHIDQLKKDHDWAIQEESRMEKLTQDYLQQDYLHMLEFENLDYRKRSVVAKEIKECRMKCRKAKNLVNTTEPILTFLMGNAGKC